MSFERLVEPGGPRSACPDGAFAAAPACRRRCSELRSRLAGAGSPRLIGRTGFARRSIMLRARRPSPERSSVEAIVQASSALTLSRLVEQSSRPARESSGSPSSAAYGAPSPDSAVAQKTRVDPGDPSSSRRTGQPSRLCIKDAQGALTSFDAPGERKLTASPTELERDDRVLRPKSTCLARPSVSCPRIPSALAPCCSRMRAERVPRWRPRCWRHVARRRR